ncbi:hypothetical protein PRZ48_002392 [Zasmidium cellare]|uniref:Uncharacterized protein n=1 Tax=Zasmidium cellare TaxID=395010 RepID=A0ABR0F5E1_ZASCE|nr:hypothetical protein PRZ48_002392 [Zasmidium cellare]
MAERNMKQHVGKAPEESEIRPCQVRESVFNEKDLQGHHQRQEDGHEDKLDYSDSDWETITHSEANEHGHIGYRKDTYKGHFELQVCGRKLISRSFVGSKYVPEGKDNSPEHLNK